MFRYADITNSSWTLYYWPKIGGRGEAVRLLFEDAAIPYTEENDPAKIMAMCCMAGPMNNNEGFPAFAPPILESSNGVRLAQSPAICKYIGCGLGYRPNPTNAANEAVTDQVNLTVHDYVGELFKVLGGGEEAKEGFKARFANYMSFFEKCMKENKDGSGEYLVGQDLTYADFALLWAFRTTDEVMPGSIDELEGHDLLKAFKARMESRQNLVEYWKSDRAKPITSKSH